MHARVLHPPIRILRQLRRRRPTRLRVRPHTIPRLPQTQCQKHRAHLCHNPTQNNLLPTRRLDCFSEVRIVPCIYLAIALDERCVGIHLNDLFGEWTVGACFGGGGHDDGEGEEGAELRMREDVVAELGGGVVFDELEEAELVIDDEEEGGGGVEALEFVGGLVGHCG